jgi:death on curing protein
MLKYLSEEDILLIHTRVIDRVGGLHGIRDRNAVKSVTVQPRQAVFGKELYSTIFLKAAVYVRNIIAHHPFLDGNKRTGVTTASVFLSENDHAIVAKEGEFYSLALHIAEDKWDYEEIAKWFESRATKVRAAKPRGKKKR